MQITFYGYAPRERSITVDQDDIATLRKLMRQEFLDHIEYGPFASPYPSETIKAILAFCARHGVDGSYTSDRLAFFKALLGGVND